MKPLRAFLFSRGTAEEWSSAAFREFEPLIDAARIALSIESGSAAIHVGFWRPETSKIAELAKQWPGTLLLSDAAIGSLPPPVLVSHAPIGEVDGLCFRVALDGFGYQIEDPSPGKPKKRPIIHPTHVNGIYAPRGWVEQLIRNKPETEALLRNADIWDEESYHEKESDLKTQDRVTMAIDRYQTVVGAEPSQTNLLSNLPACPNWFLNDELRFLNMTVRMRNVCAAHSLNTIGDLAIKGYNGLLKLPNLGQGSVHGLGTLLWEQFIHGDALKRQRWGGSQVPNNAPHNVRLPEENDEDASDVPMEKEIENILDGFLDAAQPLSQQERGIWAARMGFRCTPQTLQQIASQIGITRERVRQLEVKIYKRIHPHNFWSLLADRLSKHVDGRNSPLLFNGISAIDPWFKGIEDLKEPLREIFNHILQDNFSIIDIDDTPVITRFTVEEWERAVDSGKSLLREMANERASEEYARLQIEALIIGRGEELRDELWRTVHPFAMWANKPDRGRVLAGYGRTAEAVVLAILESAGHPLHYEEIYRQSKLISERPHEERALHHAAGNVAFLYGRGTYGLLSHCPLTKNELALVEAEVEDIAAGADPSKQWHTSELLDELLERGFDFDGQLTKYIINIALHRSKNFANMRRMIWGYKENWDASAASRLDMRQAVMALLEEAGCPLSTLEIRERLEGDRGLNNHFQIHPADNLIRMGTGLWGLADRDIKVTNPDALLDQIVEHLQSTQEGVHSTEVARLLGGISEADANALLGLVKQKGMRRDRAQYVYLANWEGSRRLWPADAVAQALNAHTQGMTIEQIRSEVNRLTKRDMNHIYISRLLIHTEGASYDPNTELWTRERSNNDERNEEESEEVETSSS